MSYPTVSRASEAPFARELLTWTSEPHNHVVQLYEDESVLLESVTEFLGAGFAAGQPLVVIATAEHLEGLGRRLIERGFDLDSACRHGRAVLLDARETLSTLLVDGVPDWELFRATVGGTLERCLEDGAVHVRVYGEMVDLLWRDGCADAAIGLEKLWNDLAAFYPLTLLCAYGIGNSCNPQAGADLERVSRAHSHVMPARTLSDALDSEARLRELALLQWRARALEFEVEQRKLLEQRLREALKEKRDSEDELRRSQRELSDFVENAVEGLHWVGPDGTILWANRAELELVGCTAGEYVGRNIAEFHAEPEVVYDILARLARGETVRDREARILRKDGAIRIVTINTNALLRDGQLVHTRCFTRDITERRRLEAEREELIESLQKTVRFSESLLAVLGHDLRNPLNAIVTSANLLLRRSASETLARPIGRILTSSDRMSRMIDQLLDFTRIRLGGGLRLERGRTDLGTVVDGVVEELEAVHGASAIELDAVGDVRGSWDPDRLAQLVSNLASNALQHRTAGTQVRIALDGREPGSVVLRVENEGMVPEDVLPALFEPFHGNADRKTQHSSGLGLGLYISQQVVLAHGGRIDVTTSRNPGTHVTVVLPRAATATSSVFAMAEATP